jgi:hypothetical protein
LQLQLFALLLFLLLLLLLLLLLCKPVSKSLQHQACSSDFQAA